MKISSSWYDQPETKHAIPHVTEPDGWRKILSPPYPMSWGTKGNTSSETILIRASIQWKLAANIESSENSERVGEIRWLFEHYSEYGLENGPGKFLKTCRIISSKRIRGNAVGNGQNATERSPAETPWSPPFDELFGTGTLGRTPRRSKQNWA